MKFFSPIIWTGGKAKHFNKIKDLLPSNINIFIEPFCGGASVSLNLMNQKLVKKYIINDLNTNLIFFFKKINSLNLDKLEKITYPNIKSISELKKIINSEVFSLTKAESFFINNNLTYNGNSYNTWSNLRLKQNFNMNKLKRLEWTKYLLNNNNVSIYNQDYKYLIERFKDNIDVVWYFDPPCYFETKFDFQEFKNQLLKIKGKWILSIEDNLEIRELFKGYNFYEYKWYYSSFVNTKFGIREAKIGYELIITNF